MNIVSYSILTIAWAMSSSTASCPIYVGYPQQLDKPFITPNSINSSKNAEFSQFQKNNTHDSEGPFEAKQASNGPSLLLFKNYKYATMKEE